MINPNFKMLPVYDAFVTRSRPKTMHKVDNQYVCTDMLSLITCTVRGSFELLVINDGACNLCSLFFVSNNYCQQILLYTMLPFMPTRSLLIIPEQ